MGGPTGAVSGDEAGGGPRTVLDASAFYAGLPFRSGERFVTTPEVFDEVRHIKRSHGALALLLQTGRLSIEESGRTAAKRVSEAAARTGDSKEISSQDASVLALCLETGGRLVTDDFAVSNVAKSLQIDVLPVMTRGISRVGRWIHYCAGCHKTFDDAVECPLCGNALRRRLLEW